MPIYYRGRISKKEFLEVLKNQSGIMRWLKWPSTVLLAILLLSLVVTLIRQPEMTGALLPGFAFPLIFLSVPWWIPYLQASSFDQPNNIYRSEVTGVIDDNGLTINGQNVHASFQLSAYTRARRVGEMLVLYQGSSCFNVFTPAMFAGEGDWQRFVTLAESRAAGSRR